MNDIGELLRIAVEVGDHEAFDPYILEACIQQQAGTLWPHFDVHIEIAKELGYLVVGPLDAVGARFAQAMGVLFVGDVDPAARLADPVEFPEEKFRPVEDLQGVPARHEIELIAFEQRLGCVTIRVFDIPNAEFLSNGARIVEACRGVVEGDDSGRIEFLPDKHHEITDAAANVGDRHAVAKSVPR